jgi:hypothetical protein
MSYKSKYARISFHTGFEVQVAFPLSKLVDSTFEIDCPRALPLMCLCIVVNLHKSNRTMNGIAKFPSCSAFDTAPQSQSAVTSKCDGSCKWRSKASARGRLYGVEYHWSSPVSTWQLEAISSAAVKATRRSKSLFSFVSVTRWVDEWSDLHPRRGSGPRIHQRRQGQ